MKKLLAFLLAACLLIGLVACAKPSTNPTDSSTGNNSASNNNTNNDGDDNNENGGEDDNASDIVLGEGPYKGKTLQIWGFASNDSYNNFKNMGVGNYIWMMRAAIDEWAAINGVTIEYINDYNQGEILSDINSGENPDLLFQHNQYPPAANFGIIGAFTEEEYNKIAQYTDKGYLDLMTMGGKSYGYVLPWTGTYMFYYNKTMFENYDVKTPKEYFMEGNWTWTTFKKCMDEMSKDLDGDGKLDTIGFPEDSARWIYGFAEDENGKLYSTMDEQITYEFLEMLYEYKVQKKTIVGRNNIWSNVTYPMVAMQYSDCEPYNFEHLYKYIKNGDLIEGLPMPRYDGSADSDTDAAGFRNLTQSTASILTSCDEREAATDLLCFILQCGYKYLEDFSLGYLETEYEGILGLTEYSKEWKTRFEKICQQRAEDFEEIPFEEDFFEKMWESFDGMKWTISKNYTGVTRLSDYKEVGTMPPASAIAAIKAKLEASLNKYNDLYIMG